MEEDGHKQVAVCLSPEGSCGKKGQEAQAPCPTTVPNNQKRKNRNLCPDGLSGHPIYEYFAGLLFKLISYLFILSRCSSDKMSESIRILSLGNPPRRIDLKKVTGLILN